MDYKKHYDRLIQRSYDRNLNVYTEKHHIIPKCLGGSNDKSNICVLTAEEHFMAHKLLVKICPNHYGIWYACSAMCMDKSGNRINNKMFGWLKRQLNDFTSKITTIKVEN